jgi:hypothetical protein
MLFDLALVEAAELDVEPPEGLPVEDRFLVGAARSPDQYPPKA